jgi:hypothetical protein
MTGISTTTITQALESLKQGVRDGTLKAARIEIPGATAEVKSKLEAKYQADVQQFAQQHVDYLTAVSRTQLDAATNSATLPDVASLSKTEAKSMLSGLQQVKFTGDLDGKTLSASNGSQNTDSLAVYMQWLQARVGIDVYA